MLTQARKQQRPQSHPGLSDHLHGATLVHETTPGPEPPSLKEPDCPSSVTVSDRSIPWII